MIGFKGDEKSLKDIQNYILQVKQFEIRDQSSRPTSSTNSFKLATSKAFTTKPAATSTASTRPNTYTDSAQWLHILREKINAALSKPATAIVAEKIETKAYDSLLKVDQELEQKIDAIGLEIPLEEPKKAIIPPENVILLISITTRFYFRLLLLIWRMNLNACSKALIILKLLKHLRFR